MKWYFIVIAIVLLFVVYWSLPHTIQDKINVIAEISFFIFRILVIIAAFIYLGFLDGVEGLKDLFVDIVKDLK
ncbi:hypothetical protein HDF24_21905 [Mucilaginibacter sp. X4EP1]|uniref:hypothetical protein n=1 Tax=Mucilaginibacter sp. X4EP1 TaxID=2723092 RepID=UPI0021670C5F|nr:hypothetical protein [Mucilaginibacter sp. X4EP1]MCS3812359.1 hypothetical protein [Mucilaginibacter sp. X4EP1]